MKLISNSSEETISAGYEFAKNLKANDIVGLFGNLGSGKTQFVKGICKYFNVCDPVNSPTFIIVNEYKGIDDRTGKTISINHFDLYRLKDTSELKEIGLDSYVNDDSVCLIEWAEIANEYFKGNMKKVFFEHGERENERIINNY
ncbi:MAG: tRNA (adenosine(37)-N6)-threonylcarbamoyltransferase complex ATPase subunit type 1 TsaE [Ignavibacteria bacterium]|nr:tRNA (adenosine(37)-N6)-threonylcarbamoyltransferase complex ATPase subunit type 1 TsaE [Ignavibacteria bacterium]